MLRHYIDIIVDFKEGSGLVLSINLMKIFPASLGYYMNKQLRFISLLLLLISGSRNIIFSQTAFASEDELKQQALKLFEEDEFEENPLNAPPPDEPPPLI